MLYSYPCSPGVLLGVCNEVFIFSLIVLSKKQTIYAHVVVEWLYTCQIILEYPEKVIAPQGLKNLLFTVSLYVNVFTTMSRNIHTLH